VSVVTARVTGAAVWRWLRNPAHWAAAADIFVILIAVSLPWSTTLVAIFAAAWLVAMAPFLEFRVLLYSLKRPICALPIVFFALAAVGTLWSEAPWGTRLYAAGPVAKLLALPLLFHHFERSARGSWVFVAFLASCTLMMVMSWIVVFEPSLSLKTIEPVRGIFVKNYIDQSQEFALCAVVLAYPIISFLRAGRIPLALTLCAIALSFLVNMAFVIVSRTALVTMPVMLMIFALLHLKWRTNIVILCVAIVLAALAWMASPQLRWTVETFQRDYQIYKEQDQPTSIGLRLEFWQKSFRFISDAPIFGHGTGSTRGLFEQAATGPKVLAGGQVVANPHNQTLNVAIQWGALGIAVLYVMWLVHLLLFNGEGLAAWTGLMVVVQNICTSLFNSHIFDFHEGWMYVLGVGVAGGMVLKSRSNEMVHAPRNPAKS
jgi:O-antigen ligase